MAPAFDGYLLESGVGSFEVMSKRIKSARSIVTKVDISRVESVELFDVGEILRGKGVEELWGDLNERSARQFSFWFLPFAHRDSRESVVRDFEKICKKKGVSLGDKEFSNVFRQDSEVVDVSIEIDPAFVSIFENYIETGVGAFCAEISSLETLKEIAASSTTYRIEPVFGISSNSALPGNGPEPSLGGVNPEGLPIVVVIDGGRTALSYAPFEYWAAPPLVDSHSANGIHGNQVTSLVCNGFSWNNKLSLPSLNCRFVTAQAIAKSGTPKQPTQSQFLNYLRGIAKETSSYAKVWNLSFNELMPSVNSSEISYLGHEINKIAREFNILPVISIGNISGENKSRLCAPADCEGSLTVSGRTAGLFGTPDKACPISLKGPAAAGMKKPDVSWFSKLRMIGGVVNTGTSYSAPLISSLAAHTFASLKAPTPDLVRALLINDAELDGHCPELGWGTPWAKDTMPWACKEGTVTLAWVSKLKAGSAYYWNELPIPPEMISDGKLVGRISLTAILKPIVSELGGVNYFSTRLQVALQARDLKGKIGNLLGTMQEAKIKESDARKDLAKWSSIRRHAKPFNGKSVQKGSMRLHARIFARDLYQYGLNDHHGLPEQEVAFVLTFQSPNGEPGIYNSMINELSGYVENATNIDLGVEVDNR
ncbi:S8 family serine peptidase [Pseudomonas fontis]|uniref:S8 family serine peptidase n=1 Tax=Pseudomonas fontis TaxID=2942633 RepID=A0ABT5NUR1_9PSED|nr:S8 family serine peptidase [Pseudomonas fontis]MDD0974268.1 S8 family serine peptidase [Pseudomonas fontis]MDD0991881.1 S8 family serine peptidase [Pseudomonas fontis]